MKIPITSFLHAHPVLLFFLVSAIFCLYKYYPSQINLDKRVPVSLVGVHHLGSSFLIDRFYVNKSAGDSIGEGGGGGSMVCCLTLPLKWNQKLKVDVRWEVDHIIKSTDPTQRETIEIDGIYRAQVPVGQYLEPGDFYVHFFPGGKVRIVVSDSSPSSEKHPIQRGDLQANQTATAGTLVKELFTSEEIAESDREIADERKKHGDWR